MHSHAAPAETFDFFVASLPGIPDAAIPVAGARAGGIGLLNLCNADGSTRANECIDTFLRLAQNRCGLILGAPLSEFESRALDRSERWNIVLLACCADSATLESAVSLCKQKTDRVAVVVTDIE